LEAYTEAKSQNLLFETAEAAKSLAYVYNMAENNQKTLKYALEASDAYRKLGMENEVIQLFYEIALVQYRLKNYKLALEYFQKLEYKQIDSLGKQEQINYFNAIALCHKKLQNYPKAFECLEKSLQVAKKYQRNDWVGILLGNKGDVFFEQGNIDSARYYWQIDIDSSKKYNLNTNVAVTLSFFGKSYQDEGNYLLAYQYYKQAQSYLLDTSLPEYEVKYKVYKGLADVLGHLDSFKLAYQYEKKAHQLDDSIQKSLQITQTKQVELDFLLRSKEKDLLEAKKNNDRRVLVAQVGIVALLIGILVLFYLLKKQQKLRTLIESQSRSILEKNEEITRQNEALIEKQEEILQQKEVILEKNKEQEELIRRLKNKDEFLSQAIDKLIAEEVLVQEKKKELEYYSQNLEKEVTIRTHEISQKNKELVNTINQLEQFSYVLAHNLRAPVARLQGLLMCLDMKNLGNPQNLQILHFLNQSAYELDDVIKDLNKVLEIKKGVEEIYEKVDLKKKIEKHRVILYEAKAELHVDLQVRYVYAVKAYAHSILYNLISNAIKYKHPNRQLVVGIRTYQDENNVYLEVEDNGIGIDLEKHQDKLFGIYKRFHTTVEGKGIGLHIVKLQVEAMGGKIEVESNVGEGTKFKMIFKKPEGVVI
jgi:signal transduction histidine kinase